MKILYNKTCSIFLNQYLNISENLKNLIDTHTLENPKLYSMLINFNRFKKDIYEELHFLESSFEVTQKALKTVKQNGKCKKLDLLRVKKQTKVKTKGF